MSASLVLRARDWFLRHPWLKLIALLCAVLTWLAIQTQLDGRHLIQTSAPSINSATQD